MEFYADSCKFLLYLKNTVIICILCAMWMLLVLVYGIIKGIREICKKKALEINSVIEVLLVYTFLSLVICIPQAPHAIGLTAVQYFWIAVKAFVIFVAWIAGFKAIKRLPISMYGILDLSRVLFASLLGIIVLKENVSANKIAGLILVSAGLLFIKFNPFKKKTSSKKCDRTLSDASSAACADQLEKIPDGKRKEIAGGYASAGQPDNKTSWFVFLAFFSCILNAVSGLLDKILMKEMNSSQLQFWYTLFMVIYYAVYTVCTKTKISKSIWKNVWVYLLAVGLVVMDKALFIANGMPDSQITVMTLIKQSSVIVAIIAGKFVFREKDILHKILCAAIIVTGIVVGVC